MDCVPCYFYYCYIFGEKLLERKCVVQDTWQLMEWSMNGMQHEGQRKKERERIKVTTLYPESHCQLILLSCETSFGDSWMMFVPRRHGMGNVQCDVYISLVDVFYSTTDLFPSAVSRLPDSLTCLWETSSILRLQMVMIEHVDYSACRISSHCS